MAADLRASSAQVSMADVMRLQAVDVFDVLDIREVRGGRAATGGALPQAASPPPADLSVQVVHHAQDDSFVIEHEYLVKGVPGRLLIWMLHAYHTEGRCGFTNREIRADDALRLPELKDNLETRLLLLQRRLEEKRAPVRILRPARGRIRLEVRGKLAVRSDRMRG